MEVNSVSFNNLEPIFGHGNIRILNDDYLVKKADINLTRIRSLTRKKIEGEPLPEDFSMIGATTCLYKMKRIKGINYERVRVNDKAFEALLDNGYRLLRRYHDKKIYLCDIHEGNIMYDGDVHFIDFDDVCVNNHYPKYVFQYALTLMGEKIEKKNPNALVLNDKVCLLHTILRLLTSVDQEYLEDHIEYDLRRLSPELSLDLNKLLFGKKEIDGDYYLDEEIKRLKKELRKP